MVSQKSIAAQLKKIGFNQHAWGRAEARELPNIILPNEEIFECVNGMYEGGFAMLVATNVRVLLIDKKPFNYLTVEDLRFDMINEIDYNHRVLGAYVDISTGNRDLKFRSYNQPRLRKLISHVQHCMAEIKQRQLSNQEGQHQHLEQINTHLQTYLLAQYQHQEELRRRLEEAQRTGTAIDSPQPPRPSPELSDYLYAQGLMAQHRERTGETIEGEVVTAAPAEELYAEGMKEVFRDSPTAPPDPGPTPPEPVAASQPAQGGRHSHFSIDVNPLKLAYSKLPAAMRKRRKFGKPSLHASGGQKTEPAPEPQATV